jgi:molybdopterin converting factor small subunit
MHVKVKLYASFCIGRFENKVCNYPDGVSISFILGNLGLHASNTIMLRNGVHASPDDVVHDADTVSFLPLLDGG